VASDAAVLLNGLRRVVTRVAKLVRILASREYRKALRAGVAAAVEHDPLHLPIAPGTVLDVGANRGQFAVVAARRWPQARLICFEPLPGAVRVLARVLGPRAEVRNLALSDMPGEVKLHVSRADDSSSLLPIGARQSATFPGTDEVGVISVPAARLDEEIDAALLTRPVLLKVDVQGGELGVLRGATGLLPDVDAVLVECSFVDFYEGQPLAHEVVEFLRGHGLVLTGAGMPTTDAAGAVVQIDLVFSRQPG
jgi:FkbM family methyltransferase